MKRIPAVAWFSLGFVVALVFGVAVLQLQAGPAIQFSLPEMRVTFGKFKGTRTDAMTFHTSKADLLNKPVTMLFQGREVAVWVDPKTGQVVGFRVNGDKLP